MPEPISINDVIVNGEPTIAPDTEGGGAGTAYTTGDSASTTINDTDYVPMSDANGNRKKSLWSNIVNKIKTALGIALSGDTYLKKDGTWGTPTDNTKVAKSGDTMTGSLTFSAANTNAIKYAGTKETYPMIKFKDNTADIYGNGIVIGGGGLVVIGGGESSDSVAATHTTGGDEVLDLASDGNVIVWTNVQNGATSANVKKFTFATDGSLNVPTVLKENGVEFYTGNSSNAEHDANNAVKNGHYYYNSNGPATSLGVSTDDGALYVQQYNDSWIGQIAQDYRNGNIFVRGKNNGSWTAWKKVRAEHADSADSAGSATTADKLNGFASRVTSAAWGVQTGTVVTGGDIDGCDFVFRKNCPSSGKLSIVTDGYFYQDEGRYRCLDKSDYVRERYSTTITVNATVDNQFTFSASKSGYTSVLVGALMNNRPAYTMCGLYEITYGNGSFSAKGYAGRTNGNMSTTFYVEVLWIKN